MDSVIRVKRFKNKKAPTNRGFMTDIKQMSMPLVQSGYFLLIFGRLA